MYSYEQRKKAIETYLGTQSVSETLRVLGYPSSKELYKWIHEYQQNGKLHKKESNLSTYTIQKKKKLPQFSFIMIIRVAIKMPQINLDTHHRPSLDCGL